MAWKTEGKIGYLVGRDSTGGAHWDTYRIVFQTPTGTQEEIQKVVFLPASVIATLASKTTAERETIYDNWTVWKRYWEKTLVAGTQNVAIEYDMTNATQDLVLTSIEIFTDSSSSSSARIKIIHESGLFIAAIDGDTKGTQEEKYSLTGYSRSVDNLNITLYKGNKYYFVYQGTSNDAFYPAYFQNENGNYKVYANTTQASQITCYPNIQNLVGIIGSEQFTNEFRNIVLNYDGNSEFIWKGYPDQNCNLERNAVSRRKSLTGSYAGNKTSLNDLLGVAYNAYCLIDGSLNGFTDGYVYRKTLNITYDEIFDFDDYNNLTDMQKQAMFVYKLNGKSLYVPNSYSWMSYISKQDVNKFNSGYTSNISLNNNIPVLRSALPDSPVEKCFYYIDGSAWSDWHATGLYLYENGNYTHYSEYVELNNFITTTSITNVFTNIPWTNIISYISKLYIDETLPSATLNPDGSRKFYLKLNNSIEV